MILRITLAGSCHFGVKTFERLLAHGVEIAGVSVADGEDRLAATGRAAGLHVHVQAHPKVIETSEIPPGTDLIITAHSHAKVTEGALAASRLGVIDHPCHQLQPER